MATVLDSNALNDLFNTQKELDDSFDIFFDEELALMSFDDPTPENTRQNDDSNNKLEVKKRHAGYFILPIIIEITALYYGIMYLF